MESNNAPDTVDLSKILTSVVQLLIRSFRTAFITTTVCLLLGLLFFYLSPKRFESKMIIQSDILSESYALKLSENLSKHIDDKDLEYLTTKLSLTLEDAKLLKEFKLVSALTPMSQQMAEKEKIIMIILVRVSDNTILPKLQKGIIEYLSSNEYIKKRVHENRRELESLIPTIDREIQMLDTLKYKLSHGKFANAKIGDVLIMDLSGLYGLSVGLYQKKFTTLHALAMVDSIQVIEELTPFNKPVWPKLSVVLLTSLLMAGFIITLIISYKSIRSQIINSAS